MIICKNILVSALQSLSPSEQDRAFSSISQPDARTAVTKFSASLVALLTRQIPSNGSRLVVQAAFRGNKGGQSGGAFGGLVELSEHAEHACRECRVHFVESECLLDFVVSRGDLLHVEMTAESEATPISNSCSFDDLDKVLLVSSPRRLFVSRVNVTKTGKTHKLEFAKAAIRARFAQAVQCSHCLPGETFDVVLLETRNDGLKSVHVAELSPSPIDSTWQRIVLDQGAPLSEDAASAISNQP